MDLVDAPKTSFMSNHNNYYYNVIHFWIKKVCVTYQRIMDTVFSKHIGQKLKVYIDNIIVKIFKWKSRTVDLECIVKSI